MSRKALSVVVAAVAVLLMVDSAAAANSDWWNNSWHYRVNVTVNTSLYNRTDWPVEHAINFTALGIKGTFDNNTVRVIEYNATSGNMTETPSQFDKGPAYNNATNAYGEVIWLLNGTRPNYTLLYYYIYFDSADWGPKPAPNYTSNLTFYNSSTTEFWMNNTQISIRVDNDHQDYTSGMEFAQFRVSGTRIFNVSASQRTIEYIRYNDTSNNQYGYDFTDNFQIESEGPIRITVRQEGDEVDWGTDTPSSQGNMTKRYTLYKNNQWLKINQTFVANTSVSRISDGMEALLLDIGRTDISSGTYAGTFTEPFSWASVYDLSSPYTGIGLINIEQTGTTIYQTDRDSTNEKIGITLPGTVSPGAGGSFSETAVVYFHEQVSHTPVTELRKRLMNGTNVTQGAVDERTVALVPNTTFDIYNLNETVYFIGNVTQDDFNLSYSANATLTAPLGAEVNLSLDKNGSIYNASYKIDPTNETGEWNLTVRLYDENDYLLNTSLKKFNVSDLYIVDIVSDTISNVNFTMNANISVKTVRNDTGIVGVNPSNNISCAYVNSSDSSDVTAVTNISESAVADGNYSANWTAPEQGDWNLTCNVTWYSNFGTTNVTFITLVKNTTTLNMNITTVTGEHNVSEVTWFSNQTFIARLNVTNLELGLGKSVNVTINTTDSTWSINITNPYPCGDIYRTPCLVEFEVTVPPGNAPNISNVTANVTWENSIGTKNSSFDWMNITVESNPLLDIVQHSVNNTLPEDSSPLLGEFTVNSTGNDHLISPITFTCSSGTVCSNFAPVLTPSSITSGNGLDKGTWTNVSVYLTIPNGQPPGNYLGIINASSSGTWNDSIILNVTITESRNWTINRTSCFRAALPNSTGNICEFEIDNTGNIELQFNITPNTSSTSLENYTYSNETLFNVTVNNRRIISFIYNTTDATNQTINTTYIINATDPAADSDNETFNITLDIVYGPDLDFFNISSAEFQQLDILAINVTLTDRLWQGISWVNANITWPNGTLIEVVNLTNDTANTPGATSNWSLNYNNTRYRDVNMGVVVFAIDNGGGEVESADRKNFTVYAKLVLEVNPTRASKRYDPQEQANIRVYANDSNYAPLEDVNVTIHIMDATNFNHSDSPKNVLTSAAGVATTDSFIVYEPVGDWTLVYFATYYDSITDRNVTASGSSTFKVDYEKIVDVQTDNTHYKGTTFSVKVYITQKGNLVNVTDNVTVNLVYSGSTIQTQNATFYSDYYEATMTLDPNADAGAYLVKAYAYDGGTTYLGYKAFDVPDSPALALTLDLSVGSTYKPGDSVLITAFLSDQNSQYINDSSINLTITDPNNNPVVMNMTAVSGTTPPKYTAEYNLSTSATLGAYTVFGNVTYNSVYTADVALFVVSETLYTEISMDPVVYLNRSMNITVTVLNPLTGQGIDADNLTLTLYNTTNGILQPWKTLTRNDFTPGATGVYTYTEIVDSNTTAGSYIALLEVKEGSYRVWGMQTFSIDQLLYYDVVIEYLTNPLTRGGFFEFRVNITNMGEFLEEDIRVTYRIDDGTVYSGQPLQIAILPTGQSQTITRNFSSVDLPVGAHMLYVAVEYGGAPIATASDTFQIQEATVTPPSLPGGAPGGGPSETTARGIPKLSIVEFYPPEVHVERGGTTYLIATVENLGGADVQDVTVKIKGIPGEWYEVIKGEVPLLKSNESSDVLIQITVPENITAQTLTLTVEANSTKSSHQRSLIMRIFSSKYELVYFEIESVKKTMRNSEDRALVALKEGKNVSAVMDKIDETRVEIRQAENFLSNHEYEKALGHLDSARELLEHVNKLLEAISGEAAPVVTPAPAAGISMPLLIFMFIMISLLSGAVVYMARDSIFGVFDKIGVPTFTFKRTRIGLPTIKIRMTRPGMPSFKMTREQRLDPEIMAKSRRLKDEISNTQRLLNTMKEQHDVGLISDSTHKELRKRNERKLKDAKSELRDLGT